MNEYSLLKTEILQNSQKLDNTMNLLYTAVSALLAFAFTQNESLIFIVPYVVIIPMYLITFETLYGMYRVGTYLLTFHEGKEYFWETRLFLLFDTLNPKRNLRFIFVTHIPFILLSLICTLLSLFFLYKNNLCINSFDFIFRLGLPIGLFIIILLITLIHKNPSKVKKDFIEQWLEVKNM